MPIEIDHPKYYNQGKIEPISVIEDWGLDFHLGNVIKYISRAGKKDPSKKLEDLKKANWYLERYIKRYEKKGMTDESKASRTPDKG